MDRYNELVLEHFNNPRNVGVIENADGTGVALNPVCGDMMKLTLRIEGDTIADARFQTAGCAAAIATSSVATEMFKGRTVSEAETLTREQIADAIGGLPPSKIHCSVLAADALKKALSDWRGKLAAAAS
jgi:nitrogen fixation NifU-like protein